MPILIDGTAGITLSGSAGFFQVGNGGFSLANTINVQSGGTGTNTLTGIVKGNGNNPLSAGLVSLVTEISGTLNVSSGGTGVTSVGTSGNVLTSNGTSWVSQTPIVTASPGTTGNVLVSNGTSWISQAPGASGLSIVNETASASTYYPTLSTVTTGTISAANTSSTKLYFVPSTGTLNATIFNALSDEKYKTNVKTISNPLELTAQLRGVWFNWVDNNAVSMGLIAQEVEKVLPDLITDSEGTKSLNYNALIGLLIEDIKELKAKIEKLENNA